MSSDTLTGEGARIRTDEDEDEDWRSAPLEPNLILIHLSYQFMVNDREKFGFSFGDTCLSMDRRVLQTPEGINHLRRRLDQIVSERIGLAVTTVIIAWNVMQQSDIITGVSDA